MVKNEIGRWKYQVFEFLPCISFKKIFSEQLFLYNERFNIIIILYKVQNVIPSHFGIFSRTSGTQ